MHTGGEIMVCEKTTSIPITIIPLYGTEELVDKIKYFMEKIYPTEGFQIVEARILRFSTGDAKAVLEQTVRGTDVYIIVDVGNYHCNYEMHGTSRDMSPDEHFQNLKRTISAIGGKAYRINVISPFLYSSRQDRRIQRESLDCAIALQELEQIDVKNLMAFDVHDNRVQNAVPFMGFDDLFPIYQVIKAIHKYYPNIVFDDEHAIFISPDFGAMNRNFAYSSELGLDLGVFYKRRSKSKMVNGSYVMQEHKYIGPDVEGKDVFIADDIICSGGTILDAATKLKELGARKIIVSCTFALFSEGIEKFNQAYEAGIIEAVFITNASYRRDEIRNAPWYREVDVTKYISYYIYCVNSGKSIAKIVDPHEKIHTLLEKHNNE